MLDFNKDLTRVDRDDKYRTTYEIFVIIQHLDRNSSCRFAVRRLFSTGNSGGLPSSRRLICVLALIASGQAQYRTQ
jgi:hypothetical protein